MRSLWFKLSVYFTLITLFGVILFTVIYNVTIARTAHTNTVTPEGVRVIAATGQPFFVQALKQSDTSIWMELTGQNLLQKLLNIALTEDENFSIKVLTEPEAYIQVTDASGNVVYSSAETLPDRISVIFGGQKENVAVAKSLERKDHIWVNLPLTDKDGIIWGTLSVLFIAEFDGNKFMLDMLMSYLSETNKL